MVAVADELLPLTQTLETGLKCCTNIRIYVT
jgi:hypothetical protein